MLHNFKLSSSFKNPVLKFQSNIKKKVKINLLKRKREKILFSCMYTCLKLKQPRKLVSDISILFQKITQSLKSLKIPNSDSYALLLK